MGKGALLLPGCSGILGRIKVKQQECAGRKEQVTSFTDVYRSQPGQLKFPSLVREVKGL